MKKKFLILFLVALVVLLGTGIDFIIAQNYDIHLVSMTPERGVADGKTVVTFTLQLKKGEHVQKGHVLYVSTNRSTLGRYETDSDGKIVVEYTCYYAGVNSKVTDIVVTAKDENNSIFVYVPAKFSFTIAMDRGEIGGGSGMTTNDIFYEIGEGGVSNAK